MSLYERNYSDLDQAVEAIDASNRKATDALFALLCQHHPEHCPEAVVANAERLAPDDQRESEAPAVDFKQTEEYRIAAWVERQKLTMPPRHRDWNMETSSPSILTIQRAVCSHFNISRSDILSIRRTKKVVEPRQIAIYLSRKLTSRSLPYIGGKFGGRDHTTCLHAVRKIDLLVATDAVFAAEIESLSKSIASGAIE